MNQTIVQLYIKNCDYFELPKLIPIYNNNNN